MLQKIEGFVCLFLFYFYFRKACSNHNLKILQKHVTAKKKYFRDRKLFLIFVMGSWM